MGLDRTAAARAATPRRWTRPAVARQPGSDERGPVGAAHGRPLGRLARPFSTLSDLSSPLPSLGQGGRATAGAGSVSRRPARARRAGSVGMLHRWHLCGRQKRGDGVGKTKRGKGTKLMAVADRAGAPVAVYVTSAAPHEVTLVEPTLQASFVPAPPERLIGDKAYDSDPLDARLARQHIELIVPHRSNRKHITQDGRPLRRYRRRWKVERLFAWLQNFRRIVVRYERKLDNYLGLVQLATAVILTRAYL
jgi:transposase